MKFNVLALTVFAVSFLQQPAFGRDPIKSADSLIALREYNSAFALLDALPRSNDDRRIVLKKIDIALNYFVLSVNHMMFSFKDLKSGENLEELRGKEGSYNSYLFPIDSVLTRLISRYPKDGLLYRYLGDYFYDVSQRYAGRWLISDDSLASLVVLNYSKAHRLHSENYHSLLRMGVIYLQRSDFESAEPSFTAAIKLDPREADPYYNLAFLHMQRKIYKRAIIFGEKAFDLYKDVDLRSDAGRLVASCYTELDDYRNALKYLSRVNQFDPQNYNVYRMILWAYLKSGQLDSASVAARRLFAIHPTYPSIAQAIIADYREANYADRLTQVFQQILPSYSANDTVTGNLYFHLANCYMNNSDFPKASASYDSAEARFRRCFSSDNEVFQVIESQMKLLRKK